MDGAAVFFVVLLVIWGGVSWWFLAALKNARDRAEWRRIKSESERIAEEDPIKDILLEHFMREQEAKYGPFDDTTDPDAPSHFTTDAGGWVYALINRSYDGLVKIGKTTRHPSERAEELSSASGVPTPFTVAFKIQTAIALRLRPTYTTYWRDAEVGFPTTESSFKYPSTKSSNTC